MPTGGSRRSDAEPGGPEERIRLRDGSMVSVRPLSTGDADVFTEAGALLRAHGAWVQRSIRGGQDSSVEVGRSRHAPAAEFTLAALDPFERRGVAVGRYHRDARRPDAADVAVGVVKGWRRKGLGTALLHSLALAATERGIRRFSSIVPVDDVAALALLRSLNPEVIVLHRGFGVVRYEVTFGRRFCKLCGRQIESTGDDGHSADGPSNQVCGTCLRRYLPKVQLRLADPWWS